MGIGLLLGRARFAAVLGYAGPQLCATTVPLATGLIIGDLLNTGFWGLVALATKGQV